MQTEAVMPLSNIRRMALENLEHNSSPTESQIGQAVLDALVQSGIDLKHGPTLEEMKALLADVARLARREGCLDHTAA
jgi:hypothetical protein